MIGASTRVFALLGDPVSHSLSPVIHNAAFRALGLDAVYVALRVEAGAVPAVMATLSSAGGGGNVTVPHKRLAASLVAPNGAPSLASCNTFWGLEGKVVGASTDEIGIERGWNGLGRPSGDWLILGTGGSALAAVRAAASVGAGFLVRSRDAQRAAGFAASAVALGGRPGDPAAVGLVVNCTPLGLDPADPLPLPVDQVPRGAAALDLVYRAGATPWVQALSQAGHRAADGRAVLLGQGAASLECWFPGVRAPTEVMGAALDRALR